MEGDANEWIEYYCTPLVENRGQIIEENNIDWIIEDIRRKGKVRKIWNPRITKFRFDILNIFFGLSMSPKASINVYNKLEGDSVNSGKWIDTDGEIENSNIQQSKVDAEPLEHYTQKKRAMLNCDVQELPV